MRSVSCPSGIKQAQGVTFTCKVTLLNTANGATGSGTVRVHQVDGGGHLEFGPNDVQVK